ncbi:MAG TPA: alpha/beta hydrolase [Gammaproteobacteria bacterium]|nr:alpha/beta hydrolase [Gammaproteobacteria bacterium]
MESRMQEVIRPDGSVVTYEVSGSGAPVLLLAPSGISSAATEWGGYFIDPRILADDFTVISMDQRYAGAGRAPLEPFSHESVFADQLAVLDALEFPDAAVIGADFYCASALKFACDAPARTRATVLVEPMGLDDSNSMDVYYGMFNETIRMARAEGLDGVIRAAANNPAFADNPAAGPWCQRLCREPGFSAALRSLGREGYITLIVDFRDGAFPWGKRYFSVNELAANGTSVPILMAPGNDELHPPGLAARLNENGVNASICGASRDNPDDLIDEIRQFLRRHTSQTT